MADFQRRKKVRRILYSPLSIGFFAILLLLLGRGVWHIFEKERIAQNEATVARADLETLEAREKALSAEIERLQSPRGIEEEIRQKFSATKPGEGVIVIVDSPQIEQLEATSTSWWRTLLHIF